MSPFSTFLRKLRESRWLGRRFFAGSGRSAVYRLSRSRGLGLAVEGVSRDTLIRLIDFPELPLKIHTRDTIKAGRSALLVRGKFPIGGRMVGVAYKRVQRRSGWKVLSAWIFGNRTLRTWTMARRLERVGIPTSRVLMVVVPRWHQPFRPSFLATEWLDQAMNLTAYAEWLEEQTAYHRRTRLHAAARQLGALIGQMHAARISHRDLKAGNLLLRNRPASVEAYVIDLDGARGHVWLSASRRLRDLSRLALAMESQKVVTHSARLRFLLAYLKVHGERADAWKPHWKHVSQITQNRRIKKHRNGLS